MKQRMIWAVVIPLFCLVGCIRVDEKSESKSDSKSNSQANQQRGGGGFIGAGSIEDVANTGRKKNANNNNQNQGGNKPAPFTERRVSGKSGYVGVLTDKVVNYDVAIRENPNWRIKEKKSSGGGYLSTLGSSYFNATANLSIKLFERNLRQQAALNGGKFPTYKQYVQAKKANRV